MMQKIGVNKEVLIESWANELGYNKAFLLSCNYPVKMVIGMSEEQAESEVEALQG